jgi:hypothetical protein
MATPGWRAGASGADLERGLPYLRTLATSGLHASYATPLGEALRRLAGSLAFLAGSLVRVWEAIPPLRWTRRTPALVSITWHHLEQFLLVAFGAHDLKTAKSDVRAIEKALAVEYKKAGRDMYVPPRADWALARFRAPRAGVHITSDVDLLTTTQSRVLTASAYAEVLRAKTSARDLRDMLTAEAAKARAALLA